MRTEKIAIVVDKVYKDFKFSESRANTLKSVFTGALHKKDKNEVTQHALRDISLEVKKGEFFGIVGRNGSGKSTLLKMLAGIYQPNKGKVIVDGKLVPFIELGVGFNPELTGRENVYLNGALLNFSKDEVDAFYEEVVEFAELEKFMDKKLKNYSSGMQVRLAFSMAIRAKADILLVDEVLAVGDADFQRKCFEYFRNLKKNKKTVVFVSHDMNAVREYCDRAALIDKSRIVKIGKAESVAKEYLRLFNPTEYEQQFSQKEKNKKGDKWGSGSAEILDISLARKIISQDERSIQFTVKIIAHKDFPDSVVPGFSIKSSSDQLICGSNSIIEQVHLPVIKKNNVISVVWEVANIFNDGTYVIEPAIADGTDMAICQWWDNAASFEVTNEKKTPYIVAPSIKLKVKK